GTFTLTSPVGGTLFAHLPAAGDFDIALAPAIVAGGAGGLMLREGLGADDAYLFVAREEAGSLRIEHRAARGGRSTVTHLPATGPWLRLARAASGFAVFTGQDGQLWTPVASAPRDVAWAQHVGLAVVAAGAHGIARATLAPIRCDARDHYYPGR